jgi:hypothetical protein
MDHASRIAELQFGRPSTLCARYPTGRRVGTQSCVYSIRSLASRGTPCPCLRDYSTDHTMSTGSPMSTGSFIGQRPSTRPSVNPKSYKQELPDLALSLERFTSSVPGDGAYYIRLNQEVIGRYRSLKAAQAAWRDIISKSDWSPTPRPIDPDDVRRREQIERWSRNRAG